MDTILRDPGMILELAWQHLAVAGGAVLIALLAQGKSAEAQAAFAKVDGPRAPLAKLWAVLAAGKVVNGA